MDYAECAKRLRFRADSGDMGREPDPDCDLRIAADLLDLAETIEAELRALSIVLVDHLGGGSEWFKRVGDEHYASAKVIKSELQRRKTDAQTTKRVLINTMAKLPAAKAALPKEN